MVRLKEALLSLFNYTQGGFNSKMVRLKEDYWTYHKINDSQFQFQNGSIKSL